MNNIKIAKTAFPVMDEIKNRWSGRAFDEKQMSEEELKSLLEAASWAPSAMNEQPWRYAVALKQDVEAFNKILNLLNPSNAVWAKLAGALLFCYTKLSLTANGNPNGSAMHDTGLANQNILLQATNMNLNTHIMGGFDREKATSEFNLSSDFKAVCIIAIGYRGIAEDLEEPFKTREQSERTRKNLSEFVTGL